MITNLALYSDEIKLSYVVVRGNLCGETNMNSWLYNGAYTLFCVGFLLEQPLLLLALQYLSLNRVLLVLPVL